MNGAAGWRMADAPADYMTQMLAGIVAFRITVEAVVAKSKLSQNREARDLRRGRGGAGERQAGYRGPLARRADERG